jgi:hypothetical protein
MQGAIEKESIGTEEEEGNPGGWQARKGSCSGGRIMIWRIVPVIMVGGYAAAGALLERRMASAGVSQNRKK